MSPVGLAHFIELVVLFIIGIQVFCYLFRKWGISLFDEVADVMIIIAFSFGLIAASATYGVCWTFMQIVFPDYTYWLIGATK